MVAYPPYLPLLNTIHRTLPIYTRSIITLRCFRPMKSLGLGNPILSGLVVFVFMSLLGAGAACLSLLDGKPYMWSLLALPVLGGAVLGALVFAKSKKAHVEPLVGACPPPLNRDHRSPNRAAFHVVPFVPGFTHGERLAWKRSFQHDGLE